MQELAVLIKWEVQIFILALVGLIAIKLLTGEINTDGLLFGRISGRPTKNNQNQYFSPERVQLLFFTIAAGFYYLQLVLNNPSSGTLPDIPQILPVTVGGSNAIYLAGKAYARWLGSSANKNK
jgi:hypothetical protein